MVVPTSRRRALLSTICGLISVSSLHPTTAASMLDAPSSSSLFVTPPHATTAASMAKAIITRRHRHRHPLRNPFAVSPASAAEDLPTPSTTTTATGATRTGSLVAGTYTGIMQFTFAAACASIIFAPVGLPLAIGIQHCLVGFVVSQAVVAFTTRVPSGVSLAVPSFECLPFLARFAVIVASAVGKGDGGTNAVLATVLAGSVLTNVLASLLLAISSTLPVDDIDRLLPPPVQAGLFAAIGWGVYLLAFDTLGVTFSPASLLTKSAATLWVPANVLGIGLWKASRSVDSPLLIPVFIVAVAALVHGSCLVTGTSIAAARAGGWLMAEAAGRPATALWHALRPSLVRWDVIFSSAAIKQLLFAAIFGPLVNTVLNFVLYGPLVGEKLDLKAECRSHSLGALAAASAGGYSNYIGLSDAAIHRKIGGLDRFSCYVASAVGALFLVAYPLCGAVGYLPTLAIAAICIFVGCDFLYDNIYDNFRTNGARTGLATSAILAVCVRKDMLWGLITGIVGAQGLGWWNRRTRSKEGKGTA